MATSNGTEQDLHFWSASQQKCNVLHTLSTSDEFGRVCAGELSLEAVVIPVGDLAFAEDSNGEFQRFELHARCLGNPIIAYLDYEDYEDSERDNL
jgi:hypothetical protein